MNVNVLRVRLVTVAGLLCLGLMNAAPIAAAPGGNGNGNGNGGGKNPPAVWATPELDSLALFGVGAAGMVGYALMRVRAMRRQDKDTD